MDATDNLPAQVRMPGWHDKQRIGITLLREGYGVRAGLIALGH